MSHEDNFPEIKVPDHFKTSMFKDVSWHNDSCPCFVLSESVLDDEHEIVVWIDHENPSQREINKKRFTVVRRTAFFEPQIIFESNYLNNIFEWLLNSFNFEIGILTRFKTVYYGNEIGFLGWLPKVDNDIEMFRVVGLERVFLVVTECGYIELREFFKDDVDSDREINRKFRNQRLIDSLPNLGRCDKCLKVFFSNSNCENCHENKE